MANDFKITGLENALSNMRNLAPKLQKKGLGAALRVAAQVVRKAAVENAKKFDRPETPNKVWKEIVTRTNGRAGRRLGGLVVQVGVKGGARKYENNKKNRRLGRVGAGYEGAGNLYYWRFLEFGTSKMKAQPFMRPALEMNVQKATDAFVNALGPAIDKAIEKGR